MMSKCSKLTPSDFLRLGVAALLLAPTTSHSQQPSPSASAQPSMAYVRIWNMLPAKLASPLELLATENKVLTMAPSYNYNAGYLPVAPGSYTFLIRRSTDTANALKKQPVILRGDTYITFLAAEKNGQPSVELIDDTQDPKKLSESSRLVIRQFFPQGRVTVTPGTGAASPPVSYGEAFTLENLPNRAVTLNLQAVGLSPDPKLWNTEVDFTYARRATLLVFPDPYGRFRPRIAFDGRMGSAALPTPPPSPRP